jgi:hypothetical protein
MAFYRQRHWAVAKRSWNRVLTNQRLQKPVKLSDEILSFCWEVKKFDERQSRSNLLGLIIGEWREVSQEKWLTLVSHVALGSVRIEMHLMIYRLEK